MNFVRKYWYFLLFVAVGIIGGLAYWQIIGCNSGSCPITSNWHTSATAGGIFGYLTAGIIKDVFRPKKG